jgi:hypothetical protein
MFEVKPSITCVDETGRELFYVPQGLELTVLETVLPGRLTTGFSYLDDLLLGGIPENFAVVLSSPSNDQRELLINRFLEVGVKNDEVTYFVTTDVGGARNFVEKLGSNFFLFLCGPTGDVSFESAPNVFRLSCGENLTEINISLLKAFRHIDSSKAGAKRICLGILSDVLLQHHAAITRKWIGELLSDLKSRGFTTLAVINRNMHLQEEVEAVIGQFEGEIQLFEKETAEGIVQILRVRKLYGQRYLENEVVLPKELRSDNSHDPS